MQKRRRIPIVQVTATTKVLAGERHCCYAPWFRTHFAGYEKAESDFDFGQWAADHAAAVHESARRIREAGYTVTIEDENWFELAGKNGAILRGKPDIVGVNSKEVLLVDVKTGRKRFSDVIQTQIYMAVWPHVRAEHEHLPIRGQVEYSTETVHVPPPSTVEGFMQQFRLFMNDLAGSTELPKAPSYNECRMCDIGARSCPDRVSEPEGLTYTDLF